MSEFAIPTIVVTIGLVASATDVRSRRIPNVLTFGAAAAGLVFHSVTGGWSGLQLSAAGWLVGTAIFLPIFLLRGMGGGDVKLLAAMGAWLGTQDTLWVAVYTSIVGGVFALIVAARHGYLATALRNIWNVLVYWYLTRRPSPLPEVTLEGSRGPRLAYAIPIFVGTVITLWRQ